MRNSLSSAIQYYLLLIIIDLTLINNIIIGIGIPNTRVSEIYKSHRDIIGIARYHAISHGYEIVLPEN